VSVDYSFDAHYRSSDRDQILSDIEANSTTFFKDFFDDPENVLYNLKEFLLDLSERKGEGANATDTPIEAGDEGMFIPYHKPLLSCHLVSLM